MRPLILLLALSGCGQAATQAIECQREAGPMPYAAAGVFGLIGNAAVSNTPERQAWYLKIDTCRAEKARG